MPTRSTVLAAAHPAAAALPVVLTVPNGYTYLIKSALVNNGGGVSDNVSVYITSASGFYGVIWNQQALAPLVRLEFEGWVAMNPGDTLTVYSLKGTSDFWISGAKLPGVA